MAAVERASARYNLGLIKRTFNADVFAHDGSCPNQTRFTFRFEREQRVGSVPTCVIGYQESGAGTIVRGAEGVDMPTSGSLWIDPTSGAVVRSEMLSGNLASGVASKITVSYSLDKRLGVRVPTEMREEYFSSSGEHLQGVASYSHFQRFSVSSKISPGR
jgi:hypothetical protein